MLEPRAARKAVQSAFGALDGLQPHGDRFVSDGVLGDLKAPLGGSLYSGIEAAWSQKRTPW